MLWNIVEDVLILTAGGDGGSCEQGICMELTSSNGVGHGSRRSLDLLGGRGCGIGHR